MVMKYENWLKWAKQCQAAGVKDFLGCIDVYCVKFTIKKSNGYWEAKEVLYSSDSKNNHDEVINEWKKEFRNEQVRFVNCVYQ